MRFRFKTFCGHACVSVKRRVLTLRVPGLAAGCSAVSVSLPFTVLLFLSAFHSDLLGLPVRLGPSFTAAPGADFLGHPVVGSFPAFSAFLGGDHKQMGT